MIHLFIESGYLIVNSLKKINRKKRKKILVKLNWKEAVYLAIFGVLLPFITNFYQIYNQLKNKQYGCSGFPLGYFCTYKIYVLGLDMVLPDFNFIN